MDEIKEIQIDIHEALDTFIRNIYPPYKKLGFTVYQAYVCSMLHDINAGISDLSIAFRDGIIEGEVDEQ